MSNTTGDHSGGYEFDENDDPLATRHTPPGGSPLWPGVELLGRFRLLHQYKGSGQSVVWAAWAIAEKRFVVLKFVHARLLEEAQRAANVPGNVIAVHEYNTAIPDNPFLVLEYASGGPVGRLAETWAGNPALLVEKFIPVVETLAKAHARGIFHRDLKPGNLLLWAELPSAPPDDTVPPLPAPAELDTDKLQIRVADWGLAVGAGDTETGFGGTPGFAAPEQWRQQATPSADVFGLAATLYFLLTGKYVMPAEEGFVNKLRDGTAPYAPPQPIHELNRNVDPRLSRVIMTSLAIDPADRHTSADALAHELKRWLYGYAVSGDGGARRVGLWVQRNRVLVTAAVAASVLAVWAVNSEFSAAVAHAASADARAEAATEQQLRAEAETKRAEADALYARLQVELTKQQVAAEKVKWVTDQTAAARTAGRRGDWPTALKLFDALIRDVDPATARQLRTERLFGYFATNNEAALLRELNALEADPNLGALAPRVKLARGAHLLCALDQAPDGRKLIRQALAAREAIATGVRLGTFPPTDVIQQVVADAARAVVLSPADALYAEALLETRPQPVLDKLNEAVRLDALHYPAHSALAFALIAAGDLDAATRQAAALAGLFPDSPVPALVRAMAALVVGDRLNMRKQLTEFGRKSRANIKLLEQHNELFADALDLMAKHAATREGLGPFEALALTGKLAQMQALRAAAFRPLAFPVPTVHLFGEWYFEIDKAHQTLVQTPKPRTLEDLQKWDAAGRQLEQLARDYPEALAHSLLVTHSFTGAGVALANGDIHGACDRLRNVSERAYRTAEQPTFAPRTPVRYQARFVGVIADIVLVKYTPNMSSLHVQRARDNLPRLFAEGRGKWSDHIDDSVAWAVKMVATPLTPKEKADWKVDTPAGREAYRDQNRQLYRIALNLIDTWADEVSTRTGSAKRKADAKAAELRELLESWAAIEELTVPVAPMPRRK